MCVFLLLFSSSAAVALYIVFIVCSIEILSPDPGPLSGPPPPLLLLSLFLLRHLLIQIGSSLYKLLEKYRAILTIYNSSFSLSLSYILPTTQHFWVFCICFSYFL